MTRSFHLLGRLQIDEAGQVLGIMKSDKGCALLAYLIVTGQSQSREKVADIIGEASSTQKSLQNLRYLLSSTIRKWVPEVQIERKALTFVPHEQTFVDFYELQAALANDNLANKNLATDHIEQLNQALERYQGDLLADFYLADAPQFNEWLSIERERLRLQVLSAHERLCNAYADREKWPAAVAAAKRWLAFDELNEEACYQLMAALVENGQLQAALQTFESFRAALDREVGIRPDDTTITLYEDIRKQTQNQKRPLIQTLLNPKHNLPTQTTSFVGRESELTEVSNLLADPDCRLLTIQASGGMGKTRLGLATAESNIAAFRDGVVFVPLAPVQSTDFSGRNNPLVTTIAHSLNFTFTKGQLPETQLLAFLQEQEKLLFIDNFEHLLETAEFLSDLLAHAPGIKLLVTSRERLNLQEEWLFSLDGLSYPPAQLFFDEEKPLTLKEVEQYTAVQLFVQRARKMRPNISLKNEFAAIAYIARLVEGMPLGIELAAAWVRQLSCAEIVQEIEQEIDFLTTTLRNVPDRHRSLRAIFTHAWGRLSSSEKLIMQKLSVFRGGFHREAARSVAGANLRHLTGLVDKSLLRLTQLGRYEIHELMRQFAAEKLAENPEVETETQLKHSNAYLRYLAQPEPSLKRENVNHKKTFIKNDMDNIRVAWRWGITYQQHTFLKDAGHNIYCHYDAHGLLVEGKELFEFAVSRLRKLYDSSYQTNGGLNDNTLLLAQMQGTLARFQTRLGQMEQAITNLQDSLSLVQESGREGYWVRGWILKWLSAAQIVTGHLAPAHAYILQSIKLFSELGDRYSYACSLISLSNIMSGIGRFDEAEQLGKESAAIYRSLGDELWLPHNLSNLGYLALVRGRYEEAVAYLQASLEINLKNELHSNVTINLRYLGDVARVQGETELAEDYYEQTLEMVSTTNDAISHAYALWGLGNLAEQMSDFERAKQYFYEAQQINRRISQIGGPQWISLRLGELSKARQRFQADLKELLQFEKTPYVLEALAGLAHVETQEGRLELALALVTLILNHSATMQEVKNRVLPLQAELRSELEEDVVKQAEAHGQELDLAEMAVMVLAE